MSEENAKDEADGAPEPEVAAVAPNDVVVPKQVPYAVIGLALAIVVLLALLVALNRRQPAAEAVSHDLSALSAKLDERRAELNRELLARGLPPAGGGGESLDVIANRLKKDSETLVGLAEKFQEMLAERNGKIAEKNAELLRSEQLRQSLAAEVSRLQEELRQASSGSPDVEGLRQDLAALQSQRDILAEELSQVRQAMAAQSNNPSDEDVEVLRRQLEEAQRARDFFEKRVNELEGAAAPEAADEETSEVEE